MHRDAGVIDRLLGICLFAKSHLFEAVEDEVRGQIERALQLDQQQLADFYDQLCNGDWVDNSATQTLTYSCELGLAACVVLKKVLWDIGHLSAYREAEGALQESRSGYFEAFETMRWAAQDVQVLSGNGGSFLRTR